MDISRLTHMRRVVHASQTSFLWMMKVLPRERRHAMYALYAFCREVDDIVDKPGDFDSKIRALEVWRAEIDRLYDGTPSKPTVYALVGPVERFDLPKDEFIAIIDGMAMDACADVRMETMDDLLLYCRRVAGAVGILSLQIMGFHSSMGRALAEHLGNAFQLTNILRDLKEDVSIGRLYVPLSLLRAQGAPTSPIQSTLLHVGFARACEDLAKSARGFYAEADRIISTIGRRQLRPVVIAFTSYRDIFDRLLERGFSNLDRPVRLSRASKLWNAVRSGFLA